jgi:predicted amino acid dehydrogenase
MDTFAYIVSPGTIKNIKDIWPSVRLLPYFIIKTILKRGRPIKTGYIKGVKSLQGEEITGYIVLCPRLFATDTDSQNLLMDTLIFCEKLGVAVIGLDEHLSCVADKIYEKISKKIKVTVTDGNAFTAWSVLEALYRYVRIKGKEIKNLSFYINRKESVLGKLCEKKMSNYAGRLCESINEADIAVNLEACLDKGGDITGKMKPGAIVCELFSSNGIPSKEIRNDITRIRSGLVKLPYPLDSKIRTHLPQDIIQTPLAETILLTLAKKFFLNYLGNAINPDNLEEIADIAARHGFEIWVPEAPLL